MLVISPFTGSYGIFYLDAANVYCPAGAHKLLYFMIALYILAALLVTIFKRGTLHKTRLFTVLGFIGVTGAAMLIQLNHPHLLVNTTANALALSLIYYVLEAPDYHVDAMTGVFNRSALLPLLNEMEYKAKRYSLIFFPVRDFQLINHALGMKNGDKVLTDLTVYIKQHYPHGYALRLAGPVFGVLIPDGKPYTRDDLWALYGSVPDEFYADSIPVRLDISLVCMNCEDADGTADFVSTVETVLSVYREKELPKVLLCDEAYKAKIRQGKALELALARALDNNGLSVYYQPIHNCEKKLVALEALVRLYDNEYGPLPTQDAVETAEQNGSIDRLGWQVLQKVCRFIEQNNAVSWGLDHIGVNLSAVQCMQPDLADSILKIREEYNVPPSLLAFEITETATGSIDMLHLNMEKLCDAGFFFLLDDFGKGNANLSHIARLPFHCVKIDKDILWGAKNNDSTGLLLDGIARLLNDMELKSVCEGVETEEQLELLRGCGVSMLQGYYFSKPLSESDLLSYIKAQGGKAKADELRL